MPPKKRRLAIAAVVGIAVELLVFAPMEKRVPS